MGRATRGCGCAIAVLALVIGAAGFAVHRYIWPWWKTKPPPASGGELRVHILDVGPINGDSILIVSPTGKSVLIDAGDSGKGKVILEALKRAGVQQLDYFIGTHPHPDHLGAADEVMKATKVLNVIDNGLAPPLPPGMAEPKTTETSGQGRRTAEKKPAKPTRPDKTASITKFYDDYKAAVVASGAHYQKAAPGQNIDLGGGARLTILAPSEPYFTRDHMKAGGNEANANSVMVRLDYGDFSMLLSGDAESQTEHKLLTKDLNLRADILKVAHHGSKYATAADFIDRVKPSVAIISVGEWNRYGHPAQVVLDRLKASGDVKLYRTDLQGEITITTRGRESDFTIKTSKEATEDLWAGRMAQKDDSSRSGFIAYGDFGPPPKERKPTKAGK